MEFITGMASAYVCEVTYFVFSPWHFVQFVVKIVCPEATSAASVPATAGIPFSVVLPEVGEAFGVHAIRIAVAAKADRMIFFTFDFFDC